jgi:crotonobetainyl-CoA:carnitine CoA-transferase CaiB-like acyl-CoA transferase
VTLDLKNPQGRAIFLNLVKTADILIQNFRPGLMKKLGLTYDELKVINPALVYASLSGYGDTGPKTAYPGVNMIALAESGLAATTIIDDLPPVPMGYALCDVVASMWASHGIQSAYIRRLKTGRGQHVDMSLLEAGLSLMVSPVAQHFHVKGDWVAQTGRNDSNAPSGFFKCSDGQYLTVFASYPALWDRFVEVMDLKHLPADPRFSTRDARTLNAEALHDLIAPIYATKSCDHWVDLLVKAGVPAAPVNTVGRMIEDPQVIAREMIVKQQHPTAGEISVIGVPVKLSETPGSVRTPAPLLGQHTVEILGALGYGAQIEALKKDGIV